MFTPNIHGLKKCLFKLLQTSCQLRPVSYTGVLFVFRTILSKCWALIWVWKSQEVRYQQVCLKITLCFTYSDVWLMHYICMTLCIMLLPHDWITAQMCSCTGVPNEVGSEYMWVSSSFVWNCDALLKPGHFTHFEH